MIYFKVQSVFSLVFCITIWLVYEKNYVNEQNAFIWKLVSFIGSVSFSFWLFIEGLVNFINLLRVGIGARLVLWLIINILVIGNSLIFGYRGYQEALLLKNDQTLQNQ